MLNRLSDVLVRPRTLQALIDLCVVAFRLVPALLVVVFLFPTFLLFGFLGDSRRSSVLDIVDRLAKWTLAKR